jgi:chemotaxis protein methyltransferase CheR
MSENECIAFLQRCLPQLGMRWAGFRKVRRQVCKRIRCRITELELPGFQAYQDYLLSHAAEWDTLDSLCFITISQFYRDKKIFQTVSHQILPGLAKQVIAAHRSSLQIWSAGCCSGEEPYTLKVIWDLEIKNSNNLDVDLQITATDNTEQMLHRAQAGKYTKGSLKELPDSLLKQAFYEDDQHYFIKKEYKEGINFYLQDIRQKLPNQMFDLILCRNLVFTYFDQNFQREILNRLVTHLHTGGFLIVGANEKLPFDHAFLTPFENHSIIFQKIDGQM